MNIYVIAGPPGIGKSTNGHRFVPNNIPIIDQDLAAYQYRKEGFSSHYDYLKSIAAFNPSNPIHLLLFYTDNLNLCLTRAHVRHKNGGHLVKPEIVTEMYEQTFPLLKQNLSLFHTFRFIDISNTLIWEASPNRLPNWLEDKDLISLVR